MPLPLSPASPLYHAPAGVFFLRGARCAKIASTTASMWKGGAPMTAEETLAEIAVETEACQRCGLYQNARRGVPGSGNPRAEVLLIGEAPSAYDDRSGVPFSGPTGGFLDELLALAGLTRAEVFLTNVVKHRKTEG